MPSWKPEAGANQGNIRVDESSGHGARNQRGDDAGSEIVDVCIVGGGVAGMVAAFRAQSLGLVPTLVEADTLLHRYPLEGSDSTGRGHRLDPVRPPSADLNLVQYAAAAVVTSAGVVVWKGEVQQRCIGCIEGAHVFGIERASGTTWRVRFSDAATGREGRVHSRSVLITTGSRSVGSSSEPEPDHLASDLSLLAGRPALVIGQSRRALLKLIEISDSKSLRNDSTPVYWCPGTRKDEEPAEKLDPQSSAAHPQFHGLAGLGDQFLKAFTRNGNIRALSSGVAIGKRLGDDGKEWLKLEPRPSPQDSGAAVGTVGEHHEFEVDCVFRIGESNDGALAKNAATPSRARAGWDLLAGLSVRVERQDQGALIVLDVAGELSLPGLYAAGEVRGHEYLLCRTFAGDAAKPPQYERVRRTHSPELDAVEASASIEAIAQRLGKETSPAPPALGSVLSQAPAPEVARWRLIELNADGSEGSIHLITNEVTEIGRKGREIAEPDDEHMADHHASLVLESDEYFIADSGEGSGVWLRIDTPEGVLLESEDQIWVGAQILVAAKERDTWTLVHYGPDGQIRDTYAIGESGIYVGRGSDHELDPSDGLLSRRHAQFCVEDGGLRVYDRGARNGTFVKVSGATAVKHGAEFRISTKGYRLELAKR
jgi:thioredoxin reductase/pSer/pThr/pTyr-binding forkhead associated (FHA) protein